MSLSVLVLCLVDFKGLPWGPPRDSGLPKSGFVVHPFFLQKSILIFDWFLEAKLAQNRSKMGAKIHQKSIQNQSDFLIDFWMRFWSQNGSQNGPQKYEKSLICIRKRSISTPYAIVNMSSILVPIFIQLASILASENHDFLEILGFKEAFKTSLF